MFDRDPRTGAMRMNRYATGKPTYGVGGSTAATSGMLSSDGYNERQRRMLERRRAVQNQLRMRSGLGSMDPNNGGVSTW